MRQEYRISKGLIYVLMAATLAFAVGPWLFVPILSSGSRGTVIFFVCWSVVWITGGVLAFLEGIRWKLIVDEYSLELTNLFRKRTVNLDDIKGYREVKNGIFLIPHNETEKRVTISMYASNSEELRSWIAARFPNLDIADQEAAHAEMLSDQLLGENEAQRETRFANYKLIARVLAVVSYILMFAVGFRQDVMLLAVFIPFICFWLMLHTHGRIMFELEKGKGSSSLSLALIISCATVGINAGLNTPALVSWHPLIPYFLIAAAVVFVPFVYTLRKYGNLKRKHYWTMALFGIISALPFGIGCGIYANFHLNRAASDVYSTSVSGKRVSHGKHTSYYITFPPVGPLQQQTDFSVGKYHYEAYRTGDTIKVVFGKGGLGAVWYTVTD